MAYLIPTMVVTILSDISGHNSRCNDHGKSFMNINGVFSVHLKDNV